MNPLLRDYYSNQFAQDCPWCGEIPKLSHYNPSNWNWLERFLFDESFVVGCRNELCPIKPRTEHYSSAEAAIEVWNSRKA